MKFINIISTVCIFIVLSAPLFSQVGKIYPADESCSDSSFCSFYGKLKEIVKNKDIEQLKEYLSDKLYIPDESSGSQVSMSGFLNYYKKNNYKELWDNFQSVFSVGGGKFAEFGKGESKEKHFYAPYTSINVVELIINNEDLFELGMHSVILTDSVRVYEKKTKDSKVIEVLSYDIVENNLDDNSIDYSKNWFPINLKNGKKGYIETKYVRNLYDVRCSFIQKQNKWKLEFIDALE